jgi:hypothetical protein
MWRVSASSKKRYSLEAKHPELLVRYSLIFAATQSDVVSSDEVDRYYLPD